MKKILTIAALMGAASLSFGQGTVNFSAGASTATRISTNSAPGGPSTGAILQARDSYYFALFVAPSTTGTNAPSGPYDPTLNGFQFTGILGTNSGVLGRMTGNGATDNPIVNGFPLGSTATFTVVGWSSNIGNTWAQAESWFAAGFNQTGFWGNSAVATGVQMGGGATPAGVIFGANPGQIAGFTLGMQPAPEPTSFALAGLGAAAMMIFRRRKK